MIALLMLTSLNKIRYWVVAGDVFKNNFDGEEKWRMVDCDNNNRNGEDQPFENQRLFFLKGSRECHKFTCWQQV